MLLSMLAACTAGANLGGAERVKARALVAWPSGLGKGLQSPVPGFDSRRHLNKTPGQKGGRKQALSHPVSRGSAPTVLPREWHD